MPSVYSKNRKTIEESVLIQRLCARDSLAFEYFYDHYSGALYGIVLRIVKRQEIAEELLSDLFLKLWEKIDTYDTSKGRLFTWMVNITRNQAIDKFRSKEMSQARKTDDIDYLVNRIDRRESETLEVDGIGLTDTLMRLPADQRFVIEHLYLKGYSHSELAEEFNIPLGTVKTRTRMALKELRSILTVK